MFISAFLLLTSQPQVRQMETQKYTESEMYAILSLFSTKVYDINLQKKRKLFALNTDDWDYERSLNIIR